jgi:hypothetical protein
MKGRSKGAFIWKRIHTEEVVDKGCLANAVLAHQQDKWLRLDIFVRELRSEKVFVVVVRLP